MKESVNIGFRVDSSNTIGTGHLVETVTLIREMRKVIDAKPLVIAHRNRFTREKLKSLRDVKIRYLPQFPSEEEETAEIMKILEAAGCRHLITNLLHRTERYYLNLYRRLSTLCVVLDNEIHAQVPATVVVNFSICQNRDFYRRCGKYETKYLVGPKYYPMDDAIKDFRPPSIAGPVKNIFLNQGGTDPYGLTLKILRAVKEILIDQEVHVVLGGGMRKRHLREIDRLVPDLGGNYRFYYNVSPRQVYELMSASDLAISAAGNALYELAYLGVPTLVVSHHERHARVAGQFEKAGASIHAGIGTDLTEAALAAAVRGLLDDERKRRRMSRNARRISNGKGAENIVKELTAYWRKDLLSSP